MRLSHLSMCFAFIVSTAASQVSGESGHKWSTIWATAPQLIESQNLPPPPFSNSETIFGNSTLRQTIKVTLGGPQIRLRISNVLTVSSQVVINNVAIGLAASITAGGHTIRSETLVKVTFNGGQDSISIPEASLAVSDPISFPVKRGQILSITVYLKDGVAGSAVTGHVRSWTDSWMVLGDQVDSPKLSGPSLATTANWYFISGIEGRVPTSSRLLSIIGDSITDGKGSTPNGNDRWPDLLSARLGTNPWTSQISLGNQGIGANCVLEECIGPNALSRIDRDVIAQSGVAYAMIFEGGNDIGAGDPSSVSQNLISEKLINAYKQFIVRTHAANILAFGATITPFGGNASIVSDPVGEREKARQRINEWIRKSVDEGKSGEVGFDAVVDFDRVLRQPGNKTFLRPEFDSGDLFHPNTVAFAAMVKAFPLDIFL